MPELENRFVNADFVIEGYDDPPSLRYGAASPREPLRDEGPFGDHTGYHTLPSPRGIAGESRIETADRGIPRGEPYPVFHVTAITHFLPWLSPRRSGVRTDGKMLRGSPCFSPELQPLHEICTERP